MYEIKMGSLIFLDDQTKGHRLTFTSGLDPINLKETGID